MRQRPARAGLAVAASVLLLGVAGCSSDDGDSAASLSSEASSAASSVTSSEESTTTEAAGGDGECAVNPNAEAVHRAVGQINQEEGSWSFKGDSNWNPCTDLTYARVDEADKPMDNAKSVLLLFHAGEYVGRDEGSPHTIQDLTPDLDGYGIDVTYKDGDESDNVLLYWNEQDNAVAYQRPEEN